MDLADTLIYKSMMLSGVPNFAFAVGYTNSSWTLKVDLVCEHLCRLLAHMDAHGYDTVVPVADDPTVTRRPLLDFSAGYVQRAVHRFPQAGLARPMDGRDELCGRPRPAAQGPGRGSRPALQREPALPSG